MIHVMSRRLGVRRARQALLVAAWISLVGGAAAAAVSQGPPLSESVRPDGAPAALGRVDWVLAEVVGFGHAAQAPNPPRSPAVAAGEQARTNLPQVLRALRITATRRLGDLLDADSQLADTVAQAVARAELRPPILEPDGRVTVEAALPLYGLPPRAADAELPAALPVAPLGSLLYEHDQVWIDEPDDVEPPAALPQLPQLPAERGQPLPPTSPEVGPSDLFATGLLIDARGLNVAGAFAPVVRDGAGLPLWHIGYVPPDLAAAQGAVEYALDWSVAMDAGRCGHRPIIVRAVAVVGGCDLVLGPADAGRLRSVVAAAQAVQAVQAAAVTAARPTITPVSPFRRVTVVVGTPEPEPEPPPEPPPAP